MPYMEVNGISIYYEITGDGGPLVFIHAAGYESSSWHSQVAYFSKEYRAITYDIRGHGRSETPEGSYSINDCVEDLHQLLDRLAVQQTCLVGLSMGGNIALSFTLRYPERVGALVLAGSNSGPMKETIRKVSKERVDKIIRLKGTDVAMNYLKVHEANASRPDLTSRLSEISRPVLIIVGDRDREAPPYLSEAMHRGIAKSRMTVLHNCGHRCNEEQPDTFNSIISDFLQTLEAM